MKCEHCGNKKAKLFTFKWTGEKLIEINKILCDKCKEEYERET
jgi:protein-arginine kinase activator protein McsA